MVSGIPGAVQPDATHSVGAAGALACGGIQPRVVRRSVVVVSRWTAQREPEAHGALSRLEFAVVAVFPPALLLRPFAGAGPSLVRLCCRTARGSCSKGARCMCRILRGARLEPEGLAPSGSASVGRYALSGSDPVGQGCASARKGRRRGRTRLWTARRGRGRREEDHRDAVA